MRNRKATVVLAWLLTLASLVALYLALGVRSPRVDVRTHEEIGRTLALEAVQLLRPGGHLTVITRDTDAFKQPAQDIALASFSRQVGKANATISTVHKLQVDPLRPVQVPPGDFVELIRHGAPADVIVSFMGPPLLSDEQRIGLGDIKPRIVAFCSGTLPETVNLRLLAEQNLLHAAVLSRPTKSPGSRPAAQPELFDNLYLRADRAALVKLSASVTTSGAP